ncbi:unnamed protein product [Trichobilharzia regenti]|nr:unnamed protein product [Trichobilharzia regenti]
MKTVHDNRIVEMRNAWEQTSIRLYLRAKRRQLHIEKQLNEVRSWFKKPTDELFEKIVSEQETRNLLVKTIHCFSSYKTK